MATHSTPPKVPAELLENRRAGWNGFVKFIIWNCVALAATLLLMLIFLRVL